MLETFGFVSFYKYCTLEKRGLIDLTYIRPDEVIAFERGPVVQSTRILLRGGDSVVVEGLVENIALQLHEAFDRIMKSN